MNFKKRVNGSWVDTPNYIHNTSTDTITTLPAVIHPTGTTATVGLKGQTLQSSIPSPTSPIMPQGTGERTGNLFDYKTAYASYIDADGDVAATTLAAIHNSLADFVGQTVTIRVHCKTVTTSRVYLAARTGSTQKTSNSIYQGNTGYMTLTVTPETADDYWLISYGSLGSGNNIYSDFMLNLGSTALPYEPYGYKIPISSANTTTPVYLGEVETTRRIKKLVLDGTENWELSSKDSNRTVCRLPSVRDSAYVVGYCTHINWKSTYATQEYNRIVFNDYLGGSLYVSLENGILSGQTVSDFKSYLAAQYAAGTPVTVWYVLATPETAVVNEPLRKIGNYADTVSSITVPTITGKDTFDVETTLKPSEVSISYTGWHDATVEEWDGSQWNE